MISLHQSCELKGDLCGHCCKPAFGLSSFRTPEFVQGSLRLICVTATACVRAGGSSPVTAISSQLLLSALPVFVCCSWDPRSPAGAARCQSMVASVRLLVLCVHQLVTQAGCGIRKCEMHIRYEMFPHSACLSLPISIQNHAIFRASSS